MKFDKARNLVKLLFALCVVFCVVGIAMSGSESALALYCPILSLLFFALVFVVIFTYCKCQHCGKRVYLGLFKAVNCPQCGRNLITGEKNESNTKGKGKKKKGKKR